MLIKICGLTRAHDALLAAELGATHLGFIFAPSPRHVTPAQAALIGRELAAAGYDARIKKVGVFVNETAAGIRAAVAEAGLDFVQLHGEETPGFAAALDLPWYKAIRPAASWDAAREAACWTAPGRILLADAFVPGTHGGTGKQLNEATALAARNAVRYGGGIFFLAGGLTPDNVAASVALIAPDGVDVASGVEEAPGIKSEEKLRALFAALAESAGGGV